MIKINLALKKQLPGVGSSPASDSNSLLSKIPFLRLLAGKKKSAEPAIESGFSGTMSSSEKMAILRPILLPVVIALVADYIFEEYKKTEIAKVDRIIQKVEGQVTQIQTELAKASRYEVLKKSLEADELILKTKINVIQTLSSDRENPPKVLLLVSQSIPEDTWVDDLNMSGTDLSINGESLSDQSIFDFVNALKRSSLFDELVSPSSEKLARESGLETSKYEIKAKRTNGLSGVKR